MSKRDKTFAAWVGQTLANYADGENDMAHDVLYRIQDKWENTYGKLPEPGDPQ